VDDGEPARERLEHDVRARVVDLRVEQQVRAPVDGRRVALGVAAGEEDAGGEAELVREVPAAVEDRAGDEQARVGEQRERPERRLQR